jgi:hypothetical protein
VTVSMHDLSVGVFVPFLGNMSKLLDHASAYADARKVDPAVLRHAGIDLAKKDFLGPPR